MSEPTAHPVLLSESRRTEQLPSTQAWPIQICVASVCSQQTHGSQNSELTCAEYNVPFSGYVATSSRRKALEEMQQLCKKAV
eukprot:1148613-Pelagomonas_calceolata.AAC.3